MEALIENYGYVFVFLGTLFGGETVLAMAGFAAHRGYLVLPWVIAVGCMGNFAENSIWFFLGRRYGATMIQRHPSWRPRMHKAAKWLRRYRVVAVIGVRFVAGFRTPGALAIGMSDIPVSGFVVLNLVGALLWAVVVAIAGYSFGALVRAVVGDVKDFELLILVLMGIVGIAVWIYSWNRSARVREGTLDE